MPRKAMTGPGTVLVFCCGLFSIGAQSLLFREYMADFQGLDLAIGLFFAACLIWVATGAFLFHKARRVASHLAKAAELLVAAYVPAFGLGYGLVLAIPHLTNAGTAASTTFWHISGSSLLATAPVGLLTGLLFPILNRRLGERENVPAGLIYAVEAAGSVVGGIASATLLHQEVSSAFIALILVVTISTAATWSALARSRQDACLITRITTAALLVGALVLLGLRADRHLTHIVEQASWDRAVPEGELRGGFSTSQAQYLLGTERDGWAVLREGHRHETVSDGSDAGRTAAIALCQSFTAERILVVGDGLSVCRSFLKSPRIKAVTWATPDPAYISAMLAYLPASLQVSDPRFRWLAGDLPDALADNPETYDIVIVNLPEAVNAASGRLLSVEFLERVKQSLRPMGLLALGVTTGEDLASAEPAYMGAWIKSTLDAVFAQTLLVPFGDRTFFVSAPSPYLEISPVTLEVRFSLLENAAAIFPPEALASVYRPDLALKALDSFDAVALPERALVSSERKPSHYLCRVLQTAHRSGCTPIKPVQSILRGGLAIVIAPIVLLVLVRLAYIVRTAPRGRRHFDAQARSVLRSDTLAIVACSGMAGFGTFLVLAHAYQGRYGSLHLDLGFLSAAFMLGLAAGAWGIRQVACRLPEKTSFGLFCTICVLTILLSVHTAFVVGAGLWIDRASSWVVFATLLPVAGLFCGGTLVLGARMLTSCHIPTESTAAGLENADHLGAAIGSVLVAILLIPLVDFQAALYVLAALALGNVAFAVAMYYHVMHPGPRVVPHPVLTPAGYSLFAVAISVVAGSHILAHIERSQTQARSVMIVQEWIEGRRVSDKTVASGSAPKKVAYQEVREQSQLKGYILRSEDFTDTVYGYGGPMSIIMFADPNGALLDYRITRSRETPRYIRRIGDWMTSLKGRMLLGPDPVAGVDTVSGATLSCDAILKLLRNSGREFTASVFAPEQAARDVRLHWTEKINWPSACWVAGVVLALAAVYAGRLWARLLALAYTVGVAGIWLNRQYSTDHAIRLLTGDGLLDGSLGSLCLLLGVPLVIMLFGNLYCGYLCPFGALQELISFVLPKRFKARLSLSTISAGRFVKYAVLFIVVVTFFINGSRRLLEADPLTAFFGWRAWSREFVTAIAVLVATLVVTRLWCRYLCPTGAFLSLFNLAGWLKRWLPAKKFGRCEFGLGGRDHLDCIYCDRCRYKSVLIPSRDEVVTKSENARSRLFFALFVCVTVVTLAAAFRRPSAGSETDTSQISPMSDVQAPAPPAGPIRNRQRRR